MNRPSVTLSSPAHPAMAEMASALKRDVTYRTVGPCSGAVSGAAGLSNPAARLAYRMAVLARGYAPGAIAYQRMRSKTVLRSAPKASLVHSCSHLVYGGYNWIGDYENVNVLAFYSPKLLASRRFSDHLRGVFGNPACRAIRVWSASAAQSFHTVFPDPEIRRKVCVVYPAIAIPPEARQSRKRSTPPRILFIARGFWVKGGRLLLDAISLLRHDFDFQVDFVCELPPECEHYRQELRGVVNFYLPNFTRAELYRRFYANADIFAMLGMADSYGVALLEAAAFGLPIVSMRLNSGLSDLLAVAGNAIQVEPALQIFDPRGVHSLEPEELLRRIRADRQPHVVERIAAALRSLLSDGGLREQVGERGRAAVCDGPLSLPAMRRELLGLYRRVMD